MSDAARTQIVLVPGFGGFDALGQIEYYAGVTPAFRAWCADAERRDVALHYFDNLPTAAVTTRALWLRSYLAKRVARGEFQRGDRLALVAHSTGGLDVRQLLADLAAAPDEVIPVDGAADGPFAVRRSDLLALIDRVVFLSVPQRGTNIADWLVAHDALRRSTVESLRAALGAAEASPVARLERWSTGAVGAFTDADLFRAVVDALRESDVAACVPDDAPGRAEARHAFGALRLWVADIESDFAAITDLACEPPPWPAPPTPARASDEARAAELRAWEQHQIATRSYATRGRCPFDPAEARAWPPWKLLDLHAAHAVGLHRRERDDTDVVYRACYRACVAGGFRAVERTATPFAGGDAVTVEAWQNDGVVNTASMLWPNGAATRIVDGDHGDIIGHFARVGTRTSEPATASRGRVDHAYDLLASGSGFDAAAFRAVWRDVFDYCIARGAAGAPVAAAPLR